jgi:ADP-dependent NAD(P)H-hydrate dehydratase / NAD(P)H-hydrate epimerase
MAVTALWWRACWLSAVGRYRCTPIARFSKLTGDAAEMAARWTGSVAPLSRQSLENTDLVVDALFGAGLTRPLDGLPLWLAAEAEERGLPCVAVDLPSGMNADGPLPAWPHFPAVLTVTFHRKKPAHVLAPSRTRCGELRLVDIGIPDGWQTVGVSAKENALTTSDLPWPGGSAYKHQRGHVQLVSGPAGRTGAIRLAARAALRVGAGLVTVLAPKAAMAEHSARLDAIMLASFENDPAALFDPMTVKLIGPAGGVGEATRAAVTAGQAGFRPMVLDADALTSFQADPEALFALTRPMDVLTPHAGEFERLFPGILADSPNRIEAARLAAGLAGCVVLLKGPDTVIADPDGRCVVNTTGTPFLATAGSGDVLAGMIAGLIAQGMFSFDAACAAAWLHGRAGEVCGPGLIAEDLPEALPALLNLLAPDGLKSR